MMINELQESAAATNTSFACSSATTATDSSHKQQEPEEPRCQCFTNDAGDDSDKPVLKNKLYDIWSSKVMGQIANQNNDNRDENYSTNIESSSWFAKLWTLHSTDELRFYHTAVHLEEMCYLLQLVINLQEKNQSNDNDSDDDAAALLPPQFNPIDETAILLSIFFHDAIYNAKSSTNEPDSAQLFDDFCQDLDGAIPKELQQRVKDYILATQKHQIPKALENDHALAVFLDLDMAVLGKSREAYLAYAALVRKEYEFVPRDVYCEKRAQVLESFLKNGDIFATPLFRQALESRARDNLAAEIDLLHQNCIPGEESKI